MTVHPCPECTDGDPSEVMVLLLNPEELEIVDVVFDSSYELENELESNPQKARSLFNKLPDCIRDALLKSQHGEAAPSVEGDAATA